MCISKPGGVLSTSACQLAGSKLSSCCGALAHIHRAAIPKSVLHPNGRGAHIRGCTSLSSCTSRCFIGRGFAIVLAIFVPNRFISTMIGVA